MPGCPDCNPDPDGGEAPTVDEQAPTQTSTQFLRAVRYIGGRGRPLSSDINEVISILGFELGRMLENEGPQYLVQGPDWHTLSADKGTRLEMVVAHLCHCGLKAVQNANALATRAESAGDKTLKVALPRGRPSQGLPGDVAGKPAGSEVAGRAGEPEQDECINTLTQDAFPALNAI